MRNDVKKEKKNSREFQAHCNPRTTSPIVSFVCMEHTRITYPVSIRILVSSFGKIWLSSSFFCVVCALLPKPPEWLFLQIPSRCSFQNLIPFHTLFWILFSFLRLSPSFYAFLHISRHFPLYFCIPYHITSYHLHFSHFYSFSHIIIHSFTFHHTFFPLPSLFNAFPLAFIIITHISTRISSIFVHFRSFSLIFFFLSHPALLLLCLSLYQRSATAL